MEEKEFEFAHFGDPKHIIRKKICLCGNNYKLFMHKKPYYYIGERGDVLMCDIDRGKFVRCNISKDGISILLYDGSGEDGKGRKHYRLEYLVATAWIANPKGYTYVKHKDGNIYNNHRGNLRWVKIRPLVQRKKRAKGILHIIGDHVRFYKSIQEASIETGLMIYKVVEYANTGEKWMGNNRMEWVFE